MGSAARTASVSDVLPAGTVGSQCKRPSRQGRERIAALHKILSRIHAIHHAKGTATNVTFADVKAKVLRSKPRCGGSAPALFVFTLKFGGGQTRHLLNETEAFVRGHGYGTRVLGPRLVLVRVELKDHDYCGLGTYFPNSRISGCFRVLFQPVASRSLRFGDVFVQDIWILPFCTSGLWTTHLKRHLACCREIRA